MSIVTMLTWNQCIRQSLERHSVAVISHCANEAFLFLPKDIDSQAKFDEVVLVFLPGSELSSERDAIRQQYDCAKIFNGNFTKCILEVIQDLSFTCNTRNLFNSYPEISYMMEYAFLFPALAVHASDLIPLFMNSKDEALKLLEISGIKGLEAQVYAETLTAHVAPRYQNYFASFALAGDPNALPFYPTITWPVADGSYDKLKNVMIVQAPFGQDTFVLGSDDENSKSKCEFWTNIAKSIVSGAGRTSGGSQTSLFQQMPDYSTDL
jgi:carboxylesterase type B